MLTAPAAPGEAPRPIEPLPLLADPPEKSVGWGSKIRHDFKDLDGFGTRNWALSGRICVATTHIPDRRTRPNGSTRRNDCPAVCCCREHFERLIGQLGTREVMAKSHSQIEALLFEEGNAVLRKLFQGYLDSLGDGTAAEPVRGPEGAERTHRRSAGRNLMTRFGAVRIERLVP